MAKPLQLLAFLFLLLTGTVAQAAPRCTTSPANQSQQITINDGMRSVLLHLPPGFDPARPRPAGHPAPWQRRHRRGDAARFETGRCIGPARLHRRRARRRHSP
ncbi:MAG: hypothetical protein PGN21_08680 [Sphingomonas paucimobilis]